MKAYLILLIVASMLMGWPLAIGAAPLVATDQAINCTANGYLYWAMIWDYSNGKKESSTPGHVDTAYRLGYRMTSFGEVHVAYLYNSATGRYVEAQALRNVRL